MICHVILLVLVGGAMSQTTGRPRGDIEDALSKRPHYSMLLDLLKSANLLDTVKGLPTMTLFAPTNNALSNLDNDEYNALKADSAKLAEFLKYHVTTDEAFKVQGFKDNDRVLDSLSNGLPIRLNVYRLLHTISAEGCNITEKNIAVANGFIQGVDCAMEAPTGDVVDVINAFPETTELAKMIAAAGLDSALRADKNITVFAPTDEAWENLDPDVRTYLAQNPALLKEVLLFHVVPRTTLYSIGMRHSEVFQSLDSHKDPLVLLENDAGDIFVDHAALDDRDLSATNGVVHTIEDVLIPTNVLVQLEDQGFGHLLG